VHLPNLADTLLGDAGDAFAQMLANMVEDVWREKGIPNGTINKQVTNEFAKRLFKGVEKGYGKTLASLDYNTPDEIMLRALQQNVWHFSAAKNYTQLKALSQALVDADGKLRSYKDFKTEAFKINDQHTNQWLKAEYELAVTSGRAISLYMEFGDNDLLEFDAVLDGRTTDLCKSLNGTVLPKNHPFWAKYWIPNHYGERSTIKSARGKKQTPAHQIPTADIPKMFETNLALNGMVFPPTHPYYKDMPKEVMSFGETSFTKMEHRRFKDGNVYKNGLTNNPAKKNDIRHFDEVLLKEKTADALAHHFKTDVYLNPEFSNPQTDMRYSSFFAGAKPFKQPDFFFNNQQWEMESYDGRFKYNKVSKMLRNGASQSENIIIKLKHRVDIANIKSRALASILKSTKRLKQVKSLIIVDVDNVVHVLK
jgi:hypothetical protein